MHIPDGILPASVTVGGYATTGIATWYSLRKINQRGNPQEGVPPAALLTAAFIVASWIHIPVPPTSVHFVLNGLLGVVLGYYAFPAILIGLFFQAILFQHGGLSTLGVNATMLGVPALVAHFVFQSRALLWRNRDRNTRGYRTLTGVFGFLGGASGVGLSVAIALVLLITTIPSHLDAESERAAILTLMLAHVPLMAIEGVFTALVVLFLQKVKPDLVRNG
jgi:cobalt/nickel transport system permease protein